ncbi:MAG: DUF3280 domain-containing protein [Dongiaceae bacterium]
MRRKTARTAGAALWLALGLLAPARPALAAAQPIPVAAFDFELIDTSLEGEMQGPREDEQRRLRLISDQLREALSASGRYVVVDIAPVREQIAAAGYLHGCNGCAATIARPLGADVAITGTVQKVSNLILNINLYISDTAGSAPRRAMSVDIRGNTDESWSRGLSYLVRNRLLAD